MTFRFAGLNAKMTEVHAAMGICNMRHIDEEIGKREKAVARYTERLQGTKGLQLFPNIEGLQRNYSYFPVVFHEEFGKNREEVLEELGKNSIFAAGIFIRLPMNFSGAGKTMMEEIRRSLTI